MLKRIASRVTAAVMLAGGLTLVGSPAYADYVYCPPDGGDCYVVVETPGGPGSPGDPGGGSGGGSPEICEGGGFPGCYKPGLGWFNPEDECFWELADPQPPAGDPIWQGHAPGDGRVYVAACGWPGLTGFTQFWRATPPPGFGGLPTPAELAAQAVNQLPIRGPNIGIAPDDSPGRAGLVGLPVWMWTPVTPATWGPASATASVPGLSVTATARAEKITWNMGDGNSVTCHNPGTPYKASFGRAESPTCGYDQGYRLPSSTRPEGRYTVAGTTTWQVTWVGGGQTGELTVTRSSSTTIAIEELQVVTR
jgi:hypothetical protein